MITDTHSVLENHGAKNIKAFGLEESIWYDFNYKGQSYSLERYYDADETYLSYFNWEGNKTIVGSFKDIINILF